MNNGAKLVVVLVVIFAGAGLYMAFFPPGGAKKTPTETGTSRTPERTPTGGSGARPVTPGTSTPPVRPPVPMPPPTTPRDGATSAPSAAGASTPSGSSAQPGTATATPSSSGMNTGASGAGVTTPNGGTPSGLTTPGAGTAGAGESTPPSVAPTPTPTPVAPPPSRPVTPPAPSPAREYTVLEGDTFSSIAEEYFGDRRKSVLIAEANPTVDPMRLAIGQRIKLPAQDATLLKPVATGTGAPSGTSGSGSAAGGLSETAGAADVAPTATAAGRYTIRKGDTLASISERFYGTKAETSWRRIFEANKVAIGEDPSRLKVGSAIVIPPRGA